MSTESAIMSPKAFISYSWSSPTHESWVLGLASRLREDGVDVILDKWDLKPGHDAYAFMESMVTNPAVRKVVMICDRAYVEKADSRSGGVGAESQIISPAIYRDVAQDKFAAVMTEEDDEGNAFVPVFYKGRIYFDFRSADRFEGGYEQLLRWLVDRPMHVKPRLGTVPESILYARPAATATQSRARRAEEAIRQSSPSAPGLIREYGEALEKELRAIAPEEVNGEPFDDAVLASVEAMRPYLRQLTEVVAVAVRFGQDVRTWDRILGILERLGTLMFRTPDLTRWNTHQFDSYKIIGYEAFLSVIALALDEERFDLAEAALRRPFLVAEHDGGNRPATSDYSVFAQYVESLEYRKQRLQLNRVSLEADLLKEARPRGSLPEFEALMQADLVLYLRSKGDKTRNNWYPMSLVYAERFAAFPVFARSESRGYFDRLAPVLGVSTPAELKDRVTEMNASRLTSGLFGHRGLPISYLANIEHLGTLD